MEKLNLKADGIVKMDNGREFTRLVGGFGEGKPVITTKQISELMSFDLRVVNQTINRNIEHFEENVDIIDLKKIVTERDDLLEMGYSNIAISRGSSKINALSQSGFLLYLRFAEGDKAIGLYKNFIEDYFKTKAENTVMTNTIHEQIEKHYKHRAYFMGMAMQEQDESKRIEYSQKAESLNRELRELEKSITEAEVKKEVVEGLKPQLHIADIISNAKGCYDMGDFAKTLEIEGMGRNNMFKWLREQKILMKNKNSPYQQFVKYFKVIPTVHENGYPGTKTLIKPKGVNYIIKRLLKDGKIVTKSTDEIISELEGVSEKE